MRLKGKYNINGTVSYLTTSYWLLLLTLIGTPINANSQNQGLKSIAYGLDLMLSSRVSKEEIIEAVAFDDGKDSTVDLVRFDLAGEGSVECLIQGLCPHRPALSQRSSTALMTAYGVY